MSEKKHSWTTGRFRSAESVSNSLTNTKDPPAQTAGNCCASDSLYMQDVARRSELWVINAYPRKTDNGRSDGIAELYICKRRASIRMTEMIDNT